MALALSPAGSVSDILAPDSDDGEDAGVLLRTPPRRVRKEHQSRSGSTGSGGGSSYRYCCRVGGIAILLTIQM